MNVARCSLMLFLLHHPVPFLSYKLVMWGDIPGVRDSQALLTAELPALVRVQASLGYAMLSARICHCCMRCCPQTLIGPSPSTHKFRPVSVPLSPLATHPSSSILMLRSNTTWPWAPTRLRATVWLWPMPF